MKIDTAIAMRSQMQTDGVIMAYNGEISDELMITLAEILKRRVSDGADPKRSRTVFAVFMEGVQNLIWHSVGSVRPAGMVIISEVESEVTVMCANRIPRRSAANLKQTLEQLALADKDTIRQLYREGMSRTVEYEGPGAGLGLLEIARRSKQPISFAFVDVSEEEVDYFIAARI
jgi:hypothetical protein